MTDHVGIAPESLGDLKDALRELLLGGASESQALSTRIISLNVFLNFLDAYHQQLHGPREPMAPAGLLSEKELRDFLEANRRSGFTDVYRVAARQAPTVKIRRMFVAMMAGYGNSGWQKRGIWSSMAGMAARYGKQMAGVGSIRIEPFKATLGQRDLDQMNLSQRARFEDYLIGSFELLGQTARWPILRDANLLILQIVLIQLSALALARDNGREDPEDSDFELATREVCSRYGPGSRLKEFLRENPLIEEVIDNFWRRKNYPFLMLQS
ncbi:MAG: hypothetical protein K1X53_12585 [Candidatus Sumerlaeaceae bacterium]|nr:hypothetical protein [Candidatus Sumerlaeaceae bacterium]